MTDAGTMTTDDFHGYISPEGRLRFVSWLATEEHPAMVTQVVQQPDGKVQLDYVDEEASQAMGAIVVAQAVVPVDGMPAEVRRWLDGSHDLYPAEASAAAAPDALTDPA